LSFQRQLGSSEMKISAMGLGCWAIGGPFSDGTSQLGWGDVDDDESVRAIHRALDMGISFFDTADVYGAGHSERILGRALEGQRRRTVVATKFGNMFDESTRLLTGHSASKKYIRSACESSLSRLKTDVIDLYQFHLNDYDKHEAEEVRETLESLVELGKIRYFGWSTDDPERARIFADSPHCVSVQHQMNVFDDAHEMVALCEAKNLASINRGPLAMGLLSGKYGRDSRLPDNDVRGAKSPEWMGYFSKGKANPELLGRLEAVRDLLRSDGRSLVQGALAWLWARSGKCIPIPGFKTSEQIAENASALKYGPLTGEQMKQIEELLGRSRAHQNIR